jgi:hypothetical protein
MAEPKHSPAPWKYDGKSRVDSLPLRVPTGHVVEIKDDDGKVIGTEPWLGGLVALVYGPTAEGQRFAETLAANIRLIEAAPDLLEACKAAMLLFDGRESRKDSALIGQLPNLLRRAIAKAEGQSAEPIEELETREAPQSSAGFLDLSKAVIP